MEPTPFLIGDILRVVLGSPLANEAGPMWREAIKTDAVYPGYKNLHTNGSRLAAFDLEGR